MRSAIIIGLLLSFTTLSFAFNPQDLRQLRETCSCPGCDFSNADLIDFKLGDEKTLNVTKAKLNKNGFVICDISNANFTGARLKNAYFSPADFGPHINSKVGQVIMQHCNFRGAYLPYAHFNAVNADSSNFNNANLDHASWLKGASFNNCNFNSAIMTHISVAPPMGGCGATFKNSNFIHANLVNSRLIADFTQANFRGANLSHCQLIACDMTTQGFQHTNFFSANLTNATLNGQPMTENLLPNALLCKTKLSSGMSNRDCRIKGTPRN